MIIWKKIGVAVALDYCIDTLMCSVKYAWKKIKAKKEEQRFRLRMQTDGKINVDKPPKCVCCFARALYSQFNLLFTFENQSEIAFCLRRQF